MTEIQFLSQGRVLQKMIVVHQREIENLRLLCESVSSFTFDNPIIKKNRPTGGAMFEEYIAMIDQREREITEEMKAMMQAQRDIAHVIFDLPNVNYVTILKLRYLDYLTWDEIAATTGYAVNTVRRYHSRALHHIKVPDKYQGEYLVKFRCGA